jgi:ectoine hydroxylase-related dioxygenase (phytanoyl-CoA dioxygenase family)
MSAQEMLLFKDKINYKLPLANGFIPHIDAPAYDHISHTEHTTANIAIDATTHENGCLEIVPSSHLMNIELNHGTAALTTSWVESQNWVPVLMAPGDLLIFSSHLAHRSSANKSTDRRATLYATYHCREAGDDLRHKYYAHRRDNFPPDHGKTTGTPRWVW